VGYGPLVAGFRAKIIEEVCNFRIVESQMV
jgi:hypothetical protein